MIARLIAWLGRVLLPKKQTELPEFPYTVHTNERGGTYYRSKRTNRFVSNREVLEYLEGR
jgi:hypothetical protein